MPRYSEEFKYSMMMKMMPPQNQSVSEVARETGLSEATLHKWRRQARAKGLASPGGEQDVERWSTQDKFLIVLETARLSEVEMAEYCRSKGLYVEQVLASGEVLTQSEFYHDLFLFTWKSPEDSWPIFESIKGFDSEGNTIYEGDPSKPSV